MTKLRKREVEEQAILTFKSAESKEYINGIDATKVALDRYKADK